MAEEASQTRLQLIRAVCADAALAFIASVVIGLIIASLAAAGIITMNLAYMLLCLAWLVAIIGTFLVPWSIALRHRLIFSFFLGVMLAVVGWYETKHYTEPPSAKDIAEEVSKIITNSGQNSRTPALPANKSAASSPLQEYSPNKIMQSSEGKVLLTCAIPPPPDASQFAHQYQDYKSGIEALGDALDIKMSTSIINGGIRLTFEAISDEGKERIWRMTGTMTPKMAIEVRRVGENEIVSFTADRLGVPLSMALNMPLEGSKEDIEKFERAMEQIIHAPTGVCHVF